MLESSAWTALCGPDQEAQTKDSVAYRRAWREITAAGPRTHVFQEAGTLFFPWWCAILFPSSPLLWRQLTSTPLCFPGMSSPLWKSGSWPCPFLGFRLELFPPTLTSSAFQPAGDSACSHTHNLSWDNKPKSVEPYCDLWPQIPCPIFLFSSIKWGDSLEMAVV